jgi:hypothetical protein
MLGGGSAALGAAAAFGPPAIPVAILASLIGGAASIIGSGISAGIGYSSSQEAIDKQLAQQKELAAMQFGDDGGTSFQMLPFSLPEYGVDVPQQTASISSAVGSAGIGQPPMFGGGAYSPPPPPPLF